MGRRVRARRLQLGLRQSDLTGAGLSYAYVSRIESGQRRPTDGVLAALAERLQTSVAYLTTGVEADVAEDRRLTMQYAELAMRSGEAAEARRQLQPLWDERAVMGPQRADLTWLWAGVLEAEGDLVGAAAALEPIVADRSNPRWLAAAVSLGRCYRTAGDLSRSIDLGERALAAAEELGLGGTDEGIRVLVSLVSAYNQRGDVFYATQLCRRALTRAEAAGTALARASAYWNASILASASNQPAEAVRLAGAALVLMADSEDDRTVAMLRSRYAMMLLRQHGSEAEVSEADRQARHAREAMAAGSGTAVDLAWCDLVVGHAALARGDLASAQESVERAERGAGEQAPYVTAEARIMLGRMAWRAQSKATARRHYQAAVAALTGAQADAEAAGLWFELGDMLDEAGDVEGSRDAYRSAAAAMGAMSPVTPAETVDGSTLPTDVTLPADGSGTLSR